MSPNAVSARVRGIGVAVITSTSAGFVFADQYVDFAGRQRFQGGVAAGALFPPGQRRQPHAGRFGVRLQRSAMLAHQYFRGRHQRALTTGFHGVQERQQRHDGLARSDISLQQPQHALVRCHVLFDFVQRGQLPIGEGKGQGGDGPGAQLAIASHPPPSGAAQLRPDQHQRQLVGEEFVIGQPPPRRCFR